MSLPFAVASVPVATAMAYFTHFAKVGVLAGSFDNTKPRADIELKAEVEEERRALAQRLHGAHSNQIETLGVFAGGVGVAVASNAHIGRVTAACAAYLALRLVYICAYLAGPLAGGYVRTLFFVACMTVLMWLWAESVVAVNAHIVDELRAMVVVFALLSVPIATSLAYLPHLVKGIMLTRKGKYDNKRPRADVEVDEKTKILCARLHGAHNNQLQSLGPYAEIVAAATAVGVPPVALGNAAAVYVGARTAYVATYIAPQVGDGAVLSLSWIVSMGAMFSIWVAAATKKDVDDE